jgi:hypothetical protein
MKTAIAALALAAALCAQQQPPMTPAERAAASDREHERIIAEINAAMNSPAMQAAMADIERVTARMNAYAACRRARPRWKLWRKRCKY